MTLAVRACAWEDPALPAVWDALHAASPRATVFQSRAWMQSWWEAFAASDLHRSSALLLVEDAAAAPVALAPLFRQQREAGPLTLWSYLLWMGHDLAPMQTLLCRDDREIDAWRAILSHVHATLPGAWFDLHDVDHATVASLAAACAPGDTLSSTGSSTCLSLSLGPDADPLACATPGLRRNMRRAGSWIRDTPGLRWTFEEGMGEDALARLAALSLARFGAASFCAEAVHLHFLALLAARMGAAMSLATLLLGDAPMHVVCGLRHANRYAYFLAGMDPAFAAHRPGYANFHLLFEHLASLGLRHFDFLRGEERYKREFGPDVEMRHHVTLVPSAARRRNAMASTLQSVRRGAVRR
jgi:CelD/BcsL family acetyltransferase involved in cellulose biosynthesis